MNTNYKFTTRQEERPNTMPQPYPPCMPQNCVPYPQYQPWPFPYNPCVPVPPPQPMYQQQFPYNPFMPPQQPMYQQQFPYNPFMPPQQPMQSSKRVITNEDREFTIDPSDTDVNQFLYLYEMTDKYICSIDFNDVRIESSTSSYRHCGPLAVTVYIRKDGSIDFILWDPYADDDDLDFYENGEEEPIDFPNTKLYTRTFTAEEIKSVGDHCMEKLLVAFMNEALQQEQKNK